MAVDFGEKKTVEPKKDEEELKLSAAFKRQTEPLKPADHFRPLRGHEDHHVESQHV